MAFSYVEYVGTAGGTTGPFSYGSVALLDADTESISTQVKVYKNGTLLTITTDYTLDLINDEVDTVVPVYNTDTLRIVRETKADARYIDYVDSTNVTAELLDLDSNQLFYLIQENRDLQTDAMVKGSDGQWAGQNRRVTNISSAVNGTDAVTLNQLNAAVVGALPASLSGIGTLVYNGDGSTTDFLLPAALATITNPDDVEVYINGLRQRPTTHYTIVSGSVSISPAPAAADRILLAYHEGTVSAVLTANSVTTTSIQDDAVTVAKIANGTDGQALVTSGTSVVWDTLTPTHVSGFDTQVRTSRLDQMAAPTAAVSYNSQKITGLSDPSASTDAATKNYVDTAIVAGASSSTHQVTITGTGPIGFTVTAPFSNVGGYTFLVPVYVNTANPPEIHASVSGVVTSGNTDNSSSPTSTSHFKYANGEFGLLTTVVRSGASNNNVSFSVDRWYHAGAGNALFKNGSTAYVVLTKGSS